MHKHWHLWYLKNVSYCTDINQQMYMVFLRIYNEVNYFVGMVIDTLDRSRDLVFLITK